MRPSTPPTPLSDFQARQLLRRLRDANLSGGAVAVSGGLTVALGGCLSLDGPVEQGVRYRLRLADGAERVLDLAWQEARLSVCLRLPRSTQPEHQLALALDLDGEGRASSSLLAARMDPEANDPGEIDRFLRRLVRGIFGRAG
ncbi:MAG TPA: hypothetical protein QF730_06915 [Planctomycetota bacterium]|jgi:hypothetical protein|nr:hypothetical protein [Planctomycetota bacterium]